MACTWNGVSGWVLGQKGSLWWGKRLHCSRLKLALYDTRESMGLPHRRNAEYLKKGPLIEKRVDRIEILTNMWILLQSIKGLTNRS
jgi:hypothetical protein